MTLIWAWVMDKLGRVWFYIAGVGAIVAVFLGYGYMKKKEGETEGKADAARKSSKDRKEQNAEIRDGVLGTLDDLNHGLRVRKPGQPDKAGQRNTRNKPRA